MLCGLRRHLGCLETCAGASGLTYAIAGSSRADPRHSLGGATGQPWLVAALNSGGLQTIGCAAGNQAKLKTRTSRQKWTSKELQ